ncbi:MAG: hypothetical protein HFJ50_07470 [Clostridia bacterium]|nr:hypothetical protein [Clostridia bacterium]
MIMWVYHNQISEINLANVMDIKPTPPNEDIEPPKEEDNNKNEEMPPKEEIPKDEELPKEDKKEDIPKDTGITKEEEQKKEIVTEVKLEKEQEKKDNIKIKNEVLPRTGNDYFLIKLILIDFCIFVIFFKSRPLTKDKQSAI